MEDFFIFVCIALAIIAVSTIILTWIKHRSPRLTTEERREMELIVNENAGLKGQVSRLEERLAVLERITVEKENSLAREIEQLRQS